MGSLLLVLIIILMASYMITIDSDAMKAGGTLLLYFTGYTYGRHTEKTLKQDNSSN